MVSRITRRTLLCAAAPIAAAAWQPASIRSELIFPPEKWHNHSSSVVELPNGDLFVCWFHGSGERQSDDVKIMAARWSRRQQSWSAPFDLADTPGFPDTNCTMFVDSKKRLWLFWPAILDNRWESALMKYRMSTDYLNPGPPKWSVADNILLIPRRLPERIKEVLGSDTRPAAQEWVTKLLAMANNKLSARLGWFTRTHAVELPSGRILLPLYSDGFDMGMMAITDDGGQTWFASEPIVGYGNIQPSVLRKRDGTLVAYMRDNGPPPKRIHMAISKDDGMSWTGAVDTSVPNPGASIEGIVLRDGRWLLVYNDLEKGRYSLAVSMSDDEGATWKWTRHLEQQQGGQFHYPSVIQGADGSIHVTYSYFVQAGKSIKHANFNPSWVAAGDTQP
jgi:predicted neuraminidase